MSEHGTDSLYQQGCRCDACRGAHAADSRARRQRFRQRVAEGDLSRVPHGTHAGYANHGCRCADCREAQLQHVADLRESFLRGEANPTHGTTSTYTNYGCRCRPCTRAHTAYCAPYKTAHLERRRRSA